MTTIADKLTLLNSTKTNIKDAIEAKGVTVGTIPFADYPDKIALIDGGGPPPPPEPVEWVRNPAWPAITPPDPTEQKLIGLYAVWPGDGVGAGGNFISVNVAGNYTVDYGDGSVIDQDSGEAHYEIDYNSIDLDGTDAPVTFTASTDTVNRTAHGYEDGMIVRFYNIVTTTEIAEAQQYYVINKTADTFQISLTPGGSPVSFTDDGSAKLLPYKVATVVITPRGGANITSVNLFVKHNQTSLVGGYSTGWLDIALSGPNMTSLTVGATQTTVRHGYLERFHLVKKASGLTNFQNLFNNCQALQSVILEDTSNVTNMNAMFRDCASLTTVPLFDTGNVTNMSQMFQGCASLTTVPLFDTSNVTGINAMFNGCTSLTTVPLFDTGNVTNMSQMFQGCASLTTVPLFDTGNVTNMNAMFRDCNSLTTVPLFDTGNVTNMQDMFRSCIRLTTVPLFDTSNVTSMFTMFFACRNLNEVPLFNTSNLVNVADVFNGCINLTTVPLFDTSKVTSMQNMFNGCENLTTVPLFDTGNVTNMREMFKSCSSLTTLPLFDTSKVTLIREMFRDCFRLTAVPALDVTAVTSAPNFTNMFQNCNSNSRIQAKDFRFTFTVANNKLSAAALDEIYTNLPTVSGQTITVSSNYGIVGDDPTIATAKGWTVTGS